ncbi:Sodium/hydrogen exchanger family-domain-containing protein [Nemania sp. FL0031]|nr:Sodium/hydrogen exchanger family-domain-containing protein [Nemania sp. FL0031]
MSASSYLPYHEPSLVELLISSTFLLALNSIGSVLDRTLACGLVGQVLIGTAWGEPGARWLSLDIQRVVSSLGYLGLILVVYAGGVETDVAALRKNIFLSVAVAITGVAVPIGLSFALLASPGPFLGTDSGTALLLPAFAAGAALCSTSLGTTFSVLQASGLSRTRLGAVLASAALLDDVVGLVMVRIITSLGQTANGGVEPVTVLRPVLVSVAFAVAVPLICRYVFKPGHRLLDRIVRAWAQEGERHETDTTKKARMTAWIRSQEAAFVFQSVLLIVLIVAADYAGASILLAAYLAGAIVSWWDGQHLGVEASSPPQCADIGSDETQVQDHDREASHSANESSPMDTVDQEAPMPQHITLGIFDTYYGPVVNRMLKPFFFASIGFSIPISQLFVGEIIWRGVIYSILMVIGKLVCGLWLVRFPISTSDVLRSLASFIALKYAQIVSKIRFLGLSPWKNPEGTHENQSTGRLSAATTSMQMDDTSRIPSSRRHSAERISSSSVGQVDSSPELATPPKPLSLYPAAVMGCAMVARGEIGFLISSMAESQGVFRRADESASEASELFLIVTWAIFLCTILGPVCTGLLVRRIKKLEKASGAFRDGSRDVLGVWGVG